MVLGFGTHLLRTLASLRKPYEDLSGEHLNQSSWHEQFTPALVKFLKACVQHALQQTANDSVRKLDEKLKRFEDIVIQESMIIRRHKSLADTFPVVRSRKPAAGIKVSLLISAVANGAKNLMIRAERTAEIKTIRIGPRVKDRVLFIDPAFFKYQMFIRITETVVSSSVGSKRIQIPCSCDPSRFIEARRPTRPECSGKRLKTGWTGKYSTQKWR